MTTAGVLATGPLDKSIHTWCHSAWDAFQGFRQQFNDLLRQHGIE